MDVGSATTAISARSLSRFARALDALCEQVVAGNGPQLLFLAAAV
jgi:hypothetical protein